MKDVRLVWGLPTERVGGEPVNPTEIAGVQLEMKLAEAPDSEWSLITIVPPSVTERMLQGVPAGSYMVRATVIGTKAGDDSEPKVTTFTVAPPKSQMGPVTTLTVEVLE